MIALYGWVRSFFVTIVRVRIRIRNFATVAGTAFTTVQRLQLLFQVYKIQTVFRTGGGKIGTYTGGCTEIDANPADVLRQTSLLRISTHRGGGQAEYPEILNIHGMAVVQLAS